METIVIINYFSFEFLFKLRQSGFVAQRYDEHSTEVTCNSPYELERLAQYIKQYM